MMSIEDRAANIKANLHQDLHTTLATEGISEENVSGDVLDSLTAAAMFHVEKLLVEVDEYQNEARLLADTDPVTGRAEALTVAREMVLRKSPAGPLMGSSVSVDVGELLTVADWLLQDSNTATLDEINRFPIVGTSWADSLITNGDDLS